MIICLGPTPTIQRVMLFDRVILDAVNRAEQTFQFASGKSVNVARALKLLGHEALCLGFVGGDSGETMRRDLDGLGIAHDFVQVRPGTRTCLTVVDRSQNIATELVEESQAVADEAYAALLDRLNAHLAGASLLVVSGSLPPGALDDLYERCVTAANKHGVRALVDARGAALERSLTARPFLIKPNCAELGATLGIEAQTPSQIAAAARRLLARGGQWAAVTMGAEGSVVVEIGTESRAWHLGVAEVETVSAIGSGDCYAAGIAAGIEAGAGVLEACRRGAACAAANAATAGAAHFDPRLIEQLLEQIDSAPID